MEQDRASALYEEANRLHGRGLLAEALVVYDQALPLFRADGRPVGEAHCLMNSAGCLNGTGRPQEARRRLEGAVPLFREYGNPADLAHCLMNYAGCLKGFGQSQREAALVRYEEATPLFRKHGNPADLAHCLMNHAGCLDGLGRREEARKQFETALRLFRKHGKPADLAHCLMNSAGCLTAFGLRERRTALRRYVEALTLFREQGTPADLAHCLMNSANCRRMLGRHELALVDYDEALELVRAFNRPEQVAHCLMNRAICLRETSRLNEALAQFQEAGALLATLGPEVEDPRRFLAWQLAILFHEQGDLPAARHHLVHALTLADRLSTILSDPGLRRDFRTTVLGTFRFGVRLALDVREVQTDDAFAITQRAKGRTLAELLAGGGDADDDPLDREELLLVQQLEQQPRGPEAATCRAALDRLRQQRGNERRQLRWSDPREPLPLADVIAALRSGEVLLDSFELDKDATLALFLLLPGTFTVAWAGTVDGSVLAPLVAAWETARAPLLADLRAGIRPTGDVLREYALAEADALAPLGELLLGPLQPFLADPNRSVTTLIVSPSGLLHRLPIAALPVPWLAGTAAERDGTDTLLDQYALQLVPTATSLAILRGRAESADRATWPLGLLAAAPFAALTDGIDYSENGLRSVDVISGKSRRPVAPLPVVVRDVVNHVGMERGEPLWPLPGSGREVRTIARLLAAADGSDAAVPLLGPDANRSTVLGRLSAARLVHLSTHGQKLGRDETVLDYRLLLAGGDSVTVQEVYEGVIPLEDVVLVCLSACVLGQVVHRGAEAMGFTQAFLQAGAGVVMAPIWAVEDGATAELMVGWYGALLGEGRPGMADAWRKAVGELRQLYGGLYDHPYYWAGFLPAGDGSLTLAAPLA